MKSDTNILKIDTSPLANIMHKLEYPSDTNTIDRNAIKENIKFARKTLKKIFIAPDKLAHVLPHYLIIGPQGAGKTTLLELSGIEFIEQDKLIQKTPEGLATVTHSNWWVTENAVFIDVPGYYLDRSSSNSIWINFLKILKRHVKLNGIIVVIDIPAILSDKTSQRVIDLMQIRLQELAKTLNYAIPVQLIFTKMDIVQGFVEFFDDLSREERELSWGIAFSTSASLNNNLVDEFTSNFDSLLQRLNERVIHRLHQEHAINKKSLIKNFCLQYAALNTAFRKVIFQLNTVTQYFKKIAISGIFFCSSKQGHQTENLLLESFASNFKLDTYIDNKINLKTQPYFVKAIFNDLLKLFHRRNPKPGKAKHWLIQIIAASLLLIASTCGYLFYKGYQQQSELIASATHAIKQYELTFSKSSNQPKFEDILLTLDALYAVMNKFENPPYPQLYLISGYQPNAIKSKLNLIYTNALQTKLYPLIKGWLEQSLAYPANSSPENMFNTLKAYLMLNNVHNLDTNYITDFLMSYAHNQESSQYSTSLATHLKNALASPSLKNTANINLISHARQILNSHPEHIIAYTLIKNHSNNLATVDIAGKDAKQVFNAEPMLNNFPQLFTKQKFEDIYQVQIPQINQIADQYQWILGSSFHFSNSSLFINTLRKMYLHDYLEKWQQVTNGLTIKSFSSFQQALLIINILGANNSPLYTYLNNLVDNTEGTLPKALLHEKSAIYIHQILQNKNALLNTQPNVTKLLTSLSHYLQQIASAKDPAKTAFTIAMENFNDTANDNTISQVLNYSQTIPFPLSKWVNEIAINTWELVLKQATAYIYANWQQQILPFYQTKIANKYPINRNAIADISVMDFTHFFGTKGIVAIFLSNYLEPFLDTNQAQWAGKTLYNLGLPLSKKTLLELERAFLIQKMFFNDKGIISHQYRIELIAATPNVSSVSINYGTQTLTFKQEGTLAHNLHWVPNNQLTVTIQDHTGKIYNANYQGPWSLLRFLDSGKLIQTSDVQHYDFEYSLQGHIVKFTLIADQLINPFIKGILEQFHFDRQI